MQVVGQNIGDFTSICKYITFGQMDELAYYLNNNELSSQIRHIGENYYILKNSESYDLEQELCRPNCYLTVETYKKVVDAMLSSVKKEKEQCADDDYEGKINAERKRSSLTNPGSYYKKEITDEQYEYLENELIQKEYFYLLGRLLMFYISPEGNLTDRFEGLLIKMGFELNSTSSEIEGVQPVSVEEEQNISLEEKEKRCKFRTFFLDVLSEELPDLIRAIESSVNIRKCHQK